MNKNLVITEEKLHPYPRVCAHRGMCDAAPDNSLPAYGAAIALGADEIELDVLPTKDGHLVSMHDRDLTKISDGTGMEFDYTLEELRRLDFGSCFSPAYKGLRILLFEDVLRKLGRTTIMNIHMKMWDLDIGAPVYEKVAELIHKYHCEKHVYMTSTRLDHLNAFHKIAPEIARCTCFNAGKGDPFAVVDAAKAAGLDKIQISHPNREVIAYAHEKGMVVNICFADTAQQAEEMLAIGADTLMSNSILEVIPVLEK